MAPNVLFLMCDQMQAAVLEPGHVCRTPNLDRLAARGVRFARAYTPNAVCSPARASLMTGRLPHNHGVLAVIHTVDDDQSCLRAEHPHWAQRLRSAGYRTGYFGKWHVERSGQLGRFGWDCFACEGGQRLAQADALTARRREGAPWTLEWRLDRPPGYRPQRFYGAVDLPPEARGMGVRVDLADQYLDRVLGSGDPWCCFVSLQEPHDPFVCGSAALAGYDIGALGLSPSARDDLAGRPGIYRKAARVWAHMTDRQRREAAACYYASITEIDALFGRLLDRVEAAGRRDDTIVVLAADHGELLGAHGLYCKNFTAAEEVYRIPLVVAGPGAATGALCDGRVGLHEVGNALLALCGCEPIDTGADSRSFADLLRRPQDTAAWQEGYAEYFGGRMLLTQRVVWDGDWKLAFNGFDEDELYDLAADPAERVNRIADPGCADVVRRLTRRMWQRCRQTGDHCLLASHYPILRVAACGPEVTTEV